MKLDNTYIGQEQQEEKYLEDIIQFERRENVLENFFASPEQLNMEMGGFSNFLSKRMNAPKDRKKSYNPAMDILEKRQDKLIEAQNYANTVKFPYLKTEIKKVKLTLEKESWWKKLWRKIYYGR